MPAAAAEPATLRRLAATTLVTNLTTVAISFVTVIVIGRALGPRGRGDVAAFQLIPSICALIFALGLPHAATYFAALHPRSAGRIVRSSASIAAGLGVVGVVVAGLATWVFLGGDQSPGVRTAGLVYSLTVVVLPILGILIHPLRSVNRTKAWNRLRLFLDSSMIGAAVLVLVHSHSLVGIAVVQLVWLLALVVLAAFQWKGRSEGEPVEHISSRSIIGFGAPTMLATLPFFLNFRVDQLIIQAVDGSEELGLYATAVTWSAASLPVINTISLLALPRLAGRTVDRDASAARFIRSSLGLAVVTAVALSVTAPVAILVLFGQAFSKSILLAIPMCFITALLGVTTTTEEVLRAYGDVRYPARAQLTGLALNIVLLAALIPVLGSWGAVIASGVAYLWVCLKVLGRVRVGAGITYRSMIPTVHDVRALWSLRHAELPRDPAGAPTVPSFGSHDDVIDPR